MKPAPKETRPYLNFPGYMNLWFATFISILMFGSTVAQQRSAETQAEVLQSEIADAASAKNYRRVLSLIDQYRALQGEHVPFVIDWYYTEAVAAYNTGQRDRALSAATAYANSGHPTYHREAIELIKTIEEGQAAKAEAEMQIHWLIDAGSRAAVVRGYAKIAGGSLSLIGVTLRCEIWNYLSTPYTDAANYGDMESAAILAASHWTRSVWTLTLHAFAPSETRSRNQYDRPPWQGFYWWEADGSQINKWNKYHSHSEGSYVLDDADFAIPRQINVKVNQLKFHERFSIDLSAFRAYQEITSPASSKIQLASDAKPPTCVLIRYRQPPSPEL